MTLKDRQNLKVDDSQPVAEVWLAAAEQFLRNDEGGTSLLALAGYQRCKNPEAAHSPSWRPDFNALEYGPDLNKLVVHETEAHTALEIDTEDPTLMKVQTTRLGSIVKLAAADTKYPLHWVPEPALSPSGRSSGYVTEALFSWYAVCINFISDTRNILAMATMLRTSSRFYIRGPTR